MRWTAVVRPALDGQRPVSSYPFLRFGNWGQNHAHYYPRLCDCFYGPHNDRWGGVGPFPFGRNNGSASVEILRNGNRNDIWRPCHGWPCAGLAPASRDPRLVMAKPIRDNPKTSRGRPATGKSPMV